MIFQVLFAALTAATMFYFLIATRRSALRRLFVLFFFGAGILFILDPDLSTRIANLVGIGRGADLIFYVSTLFLRRARDGGAESGARRGPGSAALTACRPTVRPRPTCWSSARARAR